MSKIFKIQSSIREYEIEIVKNITSSISGIYSECIIDKNVNNLWKNLSFKAPIVIDAIETNKTLIVVGGIIESLRERGATRKSVVLSIGGGIVQDVSTFAISSYMRGINWVYVPTTLLAMVDSCIGGKSSINVGKYKNIAGNFYPPQKVIVDVNFCKTLTEQQLIEGLFEAVKICYAHSELKFQTYLSLVSFQSSSLINIDLEKIVILSLATKKEFIEKDEFDNDIRLLLNFGHTFGHALEGASNFKISHGIAVGLGMLCAHHLSRSLGLLQVRNRKVDDLLDHIFTLLQKVIDLPLMIKDIDMMVALEKFQSDKKHSTKEYVAILFDNDGSLCRYKFSKNESNNNFILEAFNLLAGIENEIQ